MKIYALIAVAFACFLLTSCTNDELETKNIETKSITIQNDYYARTGDSISSDTNPVKTNGKDD